MSVSTSKEVTVEFESITDLARYIERTPQCIGSGETSQDHDTTPSNKWDLKAGFNGAMEIAGKGGVWAEGAKNLTKVHMDMGTMKSEGRVPALDYDVAGFAPDVAAMLAGMPDHMMNEGEADENLKPIVRVGIHIGRQGDVDSTAVVNRGAAILSCVDDLEDQGYRVEVWALWRNSSTGSFADFRVLVKAPEENWSPQSVAFAVCHPAFSRRLMFRVCECFPGLSGLHGGGYGTEWDGARKDFDIYFERDKANRAWEKPDTALKEAQAEFINSLKTEEAA